MIKLALPNEIQTDDIVRIGNATVRVAAITTDGTVTGTVTDGDYSNGITLEGKPEHIPTGICAGRIITFRCATKIGDCMTGYDPSMANRVTGIVTQIIFPPMANIASGCRYLLTTDTGANIIVIDK